MKGGVYRRRHSGRCGKCEFFINTKKQTWIRLQLGGHRSCHLWVLERHVDGESRSKSSQGLEVRGAGQGPATVRVHREGQRFQVLAVDVTLAAVHRLQQVLTRNDLKNKTVTSV